MVDSTEERRLLEAVQSSDLSLVEEILASGVPADTCNTKGDSCLMLASRRGDIGIADLLLKKGANVNHQNYKGSSPLIAASLQGFTKLCKRYLEMGADVNGETESKDTALSLAVWKNHTDCCNLLMEHGAKVIRVDDFGDTMLIDASKHGNVEIMTHLLELGVELNHANKKGDTALIRAAWKGEAEAVKLLLDRGAYVEVVNEMGCTALLMAALHGNRQCIKILIERQADVNKADRQGKTVLSHIASTSGSHGSIYWEGVELVVSRGADLNRPPQLGNKLLLAACKQNEAAAAKALTLAKADINFPDATKGCTPLLHAIANRGSSLHLIEMLIAQGAQINLADHEGSTPLMEAVLLDRHDVCKVLLSHGADVTQENKQGETVVIVALNGREDSKCLPLIQSAAGGDLAPSVLLLHAARNGNKSRLQSLFETSNPISSTTTHKAPPPLLTIHTPSPTSLFTAITAEMDCLDQNESKRELRIASKSAGSDHSSPCRSPSTNRERTERSRNPKSHRRSRRRSRAHKAATSIGSQDGAAENSRGQRARSKSKRHGLRRNQKIVPQAASEISSEMNLETSFQIEAGQEGAFLVSALEKAMSVEPPTKTGGSLKAVPGIDVNHQDPEGRTALMVAARAGQLGCLILLLEMGADHQIQDHQGKTALLHAIQQGQTQCAETLAGHSSSSSAIRSDSEYHESVVLLNSTSAKLNSAIKQLS
eukprot:gb/GEZN01002490.1/.p1 GENE.gb/GEZN01002490.1/~~gb/GEZN01002490.1/.p1  ORF type:complete len:712 (-),score=73.83 gb/GEZN01002490.1/:231-2366(-)